MKHGLFPTFKRVTAGLVVGHSFILIGKCAGVINGRPSIEHGTVLTYLLICLVLVLKERLVSRHARAAAVERALEAPVQLVETCPECKGSGCDYVNAYPDGSPDRCATCDGFGHL